MAKSILLRSRNVWYVTDTHTLKTMLYVSFTYVQQFIDWTRNGWRALDILRWVKKRRRLCGDDGRLPLPRRCHATFQGKDGNYFSYGRLPFQWVHALQPLYVPKGEIELRQKRNINRCWYALLRQHFCRSNLRFSLQRGSLQWTQRSGEAAQRLQDLYILLLSR